MYCDKVESALDSAGISYNTRSIVDASAREELIERGQRLQVPYMYDTEAESGMYESDDIISYILKKEGEND